jgi:hypothetical protein
LVVGHLRLGLDGCLHPAPGDVRGDGSDGWKSSKVQTCCTQNANSMHTSYRLDAAAERCLVVGLLRLGLDGSFRKIRAAAAPGPRFHWSESTSPSQSSST